MDCESYTQQLHALCKTRGYGNVSYKVLNTDPHSTTVRAEIQFGTNGCCAGTGNSYRSACEAAAEATLEAWSGAADLCEAPTASHATPLSNTIPIITNNASTSAVSMTAQSTVEVKRQHIDFSQEGGSLSNAVAMLHMYLSAVASETTAPVFEVTEAGRLYECTLRLTLQGKKIDSRGTGHSKIAAKRVASGEVLRILYPGCVSSKEIYDALIRDVELNKKGAKANMGQLPMPCEAVDHSANISSRGQPASPAKASSDPIVLAMEQVAETQRFKSIRNDAHLSIRRALSTDAGDILRLIKELAIYEREPDAVHITEETLRRDGWAGDGTAHTSPRFYCFLAVENIPSAPEMVIGMALFFTSYSTWKGMCCYLEDLIVTNTHRGRGIGEALISAVGNMCLILDMPRLSWQCLKWNEKSLAFYSSLGAVAMSDWENLRMTKDTMLCTFGENKGLTDIAATVSPPPTLQTTLTWGSAFATANEVGSVFDENVSDFLSRKRHKADNDHFKDTKNTGTTELAEQGIGTGDGPVGISTADELEEAGGFKQPALLFEFVRSNVLS